MFGFLTDCLVGTIHNGAPCDSTSNHSWLDNSSPPMFAQPWEPMGMTHYGTSPASYDPTPAAAAMPVYEPPMMHDWNR
jgi:hypothetical protein